MSEKHKFSAKIICVCGIGFMLCIIYAFVREGCRDKKAPIEKGPSVANAFAKAMEGLGCVAVPIEDLTFEFPEAKSLSTFEDLLDAIEWVESRGDANAVGDNGKAVGAYQLTKEALDDANDYVSLLWWKVTGNNVGFYTYKDRWDKAKSREIATWYIRRWTAGTGNYDATLEDKARIYNGGPRGYEKESTKAYWQKVKARMSVAGMPKEKE